MQVAATLSSLRHARTDGGTSLHRIHYLEAVRPPGRFASDDFCGWLVATRVRALCPYAPMKCISRPGHSTQLGLDRSWGFASEQHAPRAYKINVLQPVHLSSDIATFPAPGKSQLVSLPHSVHLGMLRQSN